MKGDFIIEFLHTVQDIKDVFQSEFLNDLPAYKGFGGGKNRRRRFYSGVKNLEYRQIIHRISGGYTFTAKGRKWYSSARKRYLRQFPPWDKKWRFVLFDIPQEFHLVRVNFQRRLKQLGFYPLQKSVFVFPYPCERELGDITSALKIADYIDVIVAETAGFREREIKNFFGIS